MGLRTTGLDKSYSGPWHDLVARSGLGHVTAVPSSRSSVRSAIAPIVPQTNGLLPCLLIYGW